MGKRRFFLLETMLIVFVAIGGAIHSRAEDVKIVFQQRIWDQGPHNAFTDLLRWHDKWWCTFRESDAHVGGDGGIRVLRSSNFQDWESVAFIQEAGIDLRDPKFSVTPEDRLMVVTGGSVYQGKKLLGRQPRVIFSSDGVHWSNPERMLGEGEWLWRVSWHEGRAYGACYHPQPKGKDVVGGPDKAITDWQLRLVSSRDGRTWETIQKLPEVTGSANETTLRFLQDGRMALWVRRESGDQMGWLGLAAPPYREWKWSTGNYRLGGPNFLELPGGRLIAATRDLSQPAKPSTILGQLSLDGQLKPILTLPSGGDTSYVGMVWLENQLWLSYYSSHEGKSSIYVAKVSGIEP